MVLFLILNLEFTQVEASIDWSKETQILNEAQNYIEQYRKTDVKIRFSQRLSGKPLSNLNVSYQQTSHDFAFALGGADPTDPEAYKLRENLHLNSFEIWPLNWTYIEPSVGVYNFQKYDDYIESLQKFPSAQFFVKLWLVPEAGWIDRTSPPKYTNFTAISNPTVFQNYLIYEYYYMFHVAQHFKGKIRFWITQMEINAPIYTVSEAGKTLWTVAQAVEIDKVVAKAIRAADPNATIILGTSGPEEPGFGGSDFSDPVTFTKECISNGVDFDAVAIEAWQSWGTPSFYYNYYKELTDLGKGVFIHEIQGFAAQPNDEASAWKWNVFNDTSQAAWLRYMFTIAYGSTGVMGMQWLWFRDQQQYQKGSYYANGLIDQNGSPRKSYYTFNEVISQFTTKGNGTTDENGMLDFRGFAGNYTLRFKASDGQNYVYKFTVSEKGNNVYEFAGPDNTLNISLKISNSINSVSGATILTTNTPKGQKGISGVSDVNGEFEADKILPGNYTFKISNKGYKTKTLNQTLLSDQANMTITIVKIFNYTIELTPSTLKMLQGDSNEITISVGLVSGSGNVTLSTGNLTGVSTLLTPCSGTPPFKSMAKISVDQNTKAGSYPLTFSAEGDNQLISKQVTLIVEEKPTGVPGYEIEMIVLGIVAAVIYLHWQRKHVISG